MHEFRSQLSHCSLTLTLTLLQVDIDEDTEYEEEEEIPEGEDGQSRVLRMKMTMTYFVLFSYLIFSCYGDSVAYFDPHAPPTPLGLSAICSSQTEESS